MKQLAQMFGDGMFATGGIPKKPEEAGGTGTPVAANATTPPADPSNSDAQAARDAAAEEERLRWLRGRSSTIATSGTGDMSTPNLASKNLLGT